MNKNDFIKHVLSVTDEGCESLDAGMAYDTSTYRNVILCAQRAMRWLVAWAPISMLGGSDETSPTGIFNSSLTISDGVVTLPSSFVRVARLRMSSWKRALSDKDIISEASDDYLMRQYDPQMATDDHPYAAISDGVQKKLTVKPSSTGTMTLEAVVFPDMSGWEAATAIPVPPKLANAFIYYTAYLLLTSYGDTKARDILSIVYSELGLNTKQNAN